MHRLFQRGMRLWFLVFLTIVLAAVALLFPVVAMAQDTSNTTISTQSLWQQFWSLADGAKLATLVILVGLNLLLGIILALKSKTFVLSAVGDIFLHRVLPFFGGYYLICLLAVADSTYRDVAITAFAVATAALTGYVLAGLKELGFPLPDILAGTRSTTTEPIVPPVTPASPTTGTG